MYVWTDLSQLMISVEVRSVSQSVSQALTVHKASKLEIDATESGSPWNQDGINALSYRLPMRTDRTPAARRSCIHPCGTEFPTSARPVSGFDRVPENIFRAPRIKILTPF